jgi:transposase
MKKGQAKPKKVVKLESLKQINLNAAGLDVGAAEIWACVPEDRAEPSVRPFKTFTPDLHALADWLQACDIDTVAMESTGIYWIPVYEILVERGFEVKLVNAHHIKNVPSRKSDVMDCQWVQQLHTYGLLRGSFRPDEQMRAVRTYTRHRAMLIQSRSQHIQHMQKALQQMNLQLTNVISDITGQTGLNIIRAIVAGERNPDILAQFRNSHCRQSQAEIAKALTGHYKEEHIFELQQALQLYDFYTAQMQACDVQLEAKYAAFKPQVDVTQHPLPPRKRPQREGNAPDFDLRTYLYRMTGVDLTQIDGINALTVQAVLAEIGLDLNPWPTVKHFTSWLGLCPHNAVSGGKRLNSRTKRTQNRANTALRMAAQSLSHSHSALGGYYRRQRARHGAPKAITATAHKLARIIYYMLKQRQPYRDPGEGYYEQQYQERLLKKLKRQAAELGWQLVPQPT